MTVRPRLRFAPSPTGYLHVGGARTALFNWLLARQQGGIFVLRIEDTDRERSSGEMTDAILDGLTWLGLDWDEGPHHQADGLERHRRDVDRLLTAGKAYRCFCTAEELQARREALGDEYRYERTCEAIPADEADRRLAEGAAYTVRFRVPEGVTEWDDLIHGPSRWRHGDIEDFIVLRTDGTPIYNLAVVSDDIEMRITHVIRGDDHLSNTPKQILLYQALAAEVPRFGHLPMILGTDGKRLSKRHGATSVGEYRQQGLLPNALLNFLALLGWNPGDEQEIMSPAELVHRFSLERVNKKSAVFDPDKLEWMNGQYISRMSGRELLPLVAPRLIAAGLASEDEIARREEWFADLFDLLKPRARTLDGFAPQARAYLASSVEYEEQAVAKHWKDPAETARRLESIAAVLERVERWDSPTVEQALRRAAEEMGEGFGKVVHPLRLALTGAGVSPGIDEVVVQMGRDLVSRRLRAAVEALRGKGGGPGNR
jgi:glutamyl-tRNA synthetase